MLMHVFAVLGFIWTLSAVVVIGAFALASVAAAHGCPGHLSVGDEPPKPDPLTAPDPFLTDADIRRIEVDPTARVVVL